MLQLKTVEEQPDERELTVPDINSSKVVVGCVCCHGMIKASIKADKLSSVGLCSCSESELLLCSCRKLSEFNHAVVLTNLPIKDNQLFEIELIKLTARWAGSIEIGFTTHSPDRLEFPATMTNMTSGTWMVSGKGVIHNRSNVKRDLGFDLDGLVVG